MSSINVSEVKKLANLSALVLTDEEANSITKEIEKILNYVEQLEEVDTSGVEPTYQVVDLKNVYRQDEVVESVASKDLLKLAPYTKDQQILVPKVL